MIAVQTNLQKSQLPPLLYFKTRLPQHPCQWSLKTGQGGSLQNRPL